MPVQIYPGLNPYISQQLLSESMVPRPKIAFEEEDELEAKIQSYLKWEVKRRVDFITSPQLLTNIFNKLHQRPKQIETQLIGCCP